MNALESYADAPAESMSADDASSLAAALTEAALRLRATEADVAEGLDGVALPPWSASLELATDARGLVTRGRDRLEAWLLLQSSSDDADAAAPVSTATNSNAAASAIVAAALRASGGLSASTRAALAARRAAAIVPLRAPANSNPSNPRVAVEQLLARAHRALAEEADAARSLLGEGGGGKEEREGDESWNPSSPDVVSAFLDVATEPIGRSLSEGLSAVVSAFPPGEAGALACLALCGALDDLGPALVNVAGGSEAGPVPAAMRAMRVDAAARARAWAGREGASFARRPSVATMGRAGAAALRLCEGREGGDRGQGRSSMLGAGARARDGPLRAALAALLEPVEAAALSAGSSADRDSLIEALLDGYGAVPALARRRAGLAARLVGVPPPPLEEEEDEDGRA